MNLNTVRRNVDKIILISAIALSVGLAPIVANAANAANAATAEDLNQDAIRSLQTLYRSHPEAEQLASRAKAVLVFPKVIKAGLVFGGSYGEGVMLKDNKPSGYYNSVSATWGLQVGAESYGYAIFLMNDSALNYLENTRGWEIGVGPSLVVVNEGVGKNISTTTTKDDAYAYTFDQKGLRIGLSIEGTKISPIRKQ